MSLRFVRMARGAVKVCGSDSSILKEKARLDAHSDVMPLLLKQRLNGLGHQPSRLTVQREQSFDLYLQQRT